MKNASTEATRQRLNDLTGKVIGLCIEIPLKQGVKRVACGDLFKDETGGRSSAFQLLSFLCVSVPLWFQS